MTVDQTAHADGGDHAALIAACAAGNRDALHTLMTVEGAQMLGVALRMLRRRDLAEDAVQDCLVKVWRKASQFDPARGSARGWLYTILRNRCLTMMRQESREIATEDETLQRTRDEDVVEEAFDRLASDSDLRRCLGGLEPARRSAVLLSYVLGYSHGEISGRMRAPLGSVKAWLRRGLNQLRECMS